MTTWNGERCKRSNTCTDGNCLAYVDWQKSTDLCTPKILMGKFLKICVVMDLHNFLFFYFCLYFNLFVITSFQICFPVLLFNNMHYLKCMFSHTHTRTHTHTHTHIYVYIYIYMYVRKFQDFFVQVFKIVVEPSKFSMLLLYILWDDWPILWFQVQMNSYSRNWNTPY